LIILSSCKNKIGRFTPKGLSVRSLIALISFLQFSVSPDDVSIIPKPPAFETAGPYRLIVKQVIGNDQPLERNQLGAPCSFGV
jgi:hypothetical protein